MSENERLKEIRKLLDYTQREFSDALDIKQGSYSDVERGKAGISAVLLKNLIRRFRINPLWLCEGEGDMFINATSGISITTTSTPIINKSKGSSIESENELTAQQLEQFQQLEQQRDNIDSLNSIIDFLKKDE